MGVTTAACGTAELPLRPQEEMCQATDAQCDTTGGFTFFAPIPMAHEPAMFRSMGAHTQCVTFGGDHADVW